MIEGKELEARPALMATEVCTQRKNGELCMMILYRLFFLFFWCPPLLPSALIAASSSASRSSSIEAILAPTVLDCNHPPYVRGGS